MTTRDIARPGHLKQGGALLDTSQAAAKKRSGEKQDQTPTARTRIEDMPVPVLNWGPPPVPPVPRLAAGLIDQATDTY
jgi:hypothetical protein